MSASGWRDKLPVHPAADVFPLLPKPELQQLADDIAANGLLEGVALWFNPAAEQEELLDGRNRLDALELLGDEIFDKRGKVRKEWLEKTFLNGVDPASYVIGRNIRRRHLTKKRQADLIVAAVKAGKTRRAGFAQRRDSATGRMESGGDPVKAEILKEAKKHGIGERTATQALVDAEPERKRTKTPKPKPIDEVQDVLFELIDQQAATLAKLGHGKVTLKVAARFADGTSIERRASHG